MVGRASSHVPNSRSTVRSTGARRISRVPTPPDGERRRNTARAVVAVRSRPYALRTGDAAFGVRAGWSIGYAGGGASFEALYLFRIDGKTLRVVFAQPMMYFQDIGGDWHRDGTRDHDITEGSNTLNVLPTSTEGFHDLQLRQRGGKWRQTFRWSAADGEYQPR